MTCPDPQPDHPALSAQLTVGTLELTGRLLQASNQTFLASLTTSDGLFECVYKPIRGERPLWDFPHSTLGLREVAAYVASRVGGFDVVPVTVLAEGPFGLGSLQAWVQEDETGSDTLVDIVPTESLPRPGWIEVFEGSGAYDGRVSVIHADSPDLKLMAVFDALINNADRKGGHIIASQGRVFGVDHGVSFHTDHKLRTLLWGFGGNELDERELTAVRRVRDDGPEELRELISENEIEALVRRADVLIRRGRLPKPRGSWPDIPWPVF